MKNKSKKILAGLGVGLTLAGSGLFMTGCSMSEEQENALNSIVGKADQLIEVIEKTNQKLTREEAINLYEYAKTKLLVNKDNIWNNLRIKIDVKTSENWEDVGDVINCEYHLFKKLDGKRLGYYTYKTHSTELNADSEEISGYFDDSASKSDYIAEVYNVVSDMMDFNEVDLDNIITIEESESGNYIMTLCSEIEFASTNFLPEGFTIALECPTIIVCEITKEGVLVSKRYTNILDDDGKDKGAGEYTPNYREFDCTITYLYDSLTESEVDGYIAKINI